MAEEAGTTPGAGADEGTLDVTGFSVSGEEVLPGKAEARTFSQDDLDRIVKDRLARQKSQFADYEDLKAKAARLDEVEAANLSELEKAQKAAADAAAELDRIRTEAQEARLTAAILAEVAKADRKVVDPEAALRLLDRSTLELGEDGVPTNTADAVDALLEARPFLVSSVGGSARGNADQGARKPGPTQLSREALASMKPDEINRARIEGRLNDVLAGKQ